MDSESGRQDETMWPPGTVVIEDLRQPTDHIILQPVPTSDPNDPLNWSTPRKAVQFILICFFILWTFVQLDIGFTAWGPIIAELGFSIDILNDAAAVNYAGLAIGCVFFIPFVHKYGRRPIYIFSTALQFASCIWQAKVQTNGDLIGSNLISGLGGAVSETLVQITIADMFFVHHHATMNGFYLFATFTGAFLGPVASGYVVESEGWRWMWWWCVIFLGVTLLLILFFFEESKYIPLMFGGRTDTLQGEGQTDSASHSIGQDDKKLDLTLTTERSRTTLDPNIKLKSHRQRLALITKTDGSITHHFYQPIVMLFTFPAVTYTALTFGSTLAWFAIMTSVQAAYMIIPPYNFSAIGIGLMNLPPFIGSCLGFFVGGIISDRSILWMAKRNRGVYEPEMRLWLALPAALLLPAGILMFGIGLAHGSHWIVLAVGYGIFGFAMMICTDVCLSYLTDCYQDIVSDALVGVVFTRNAFSVVVLFTVTPWVNGMGIQNLHILTAVLCFVILLIPLPLLIWGKRARVATAKRYRAMALRQPMHRMV